MKDFNSFIQDLSTLVSFESTASLPLDGKPFGEEVSKAIEYFLSLARSFGFKTINHNGYIGEVIFGEGEEVGIIGHLDVVPTGIGWNSNPFTLVEKDDIYYARGIVDDKAPILLCLYALKELKESGKKVERKFRLFVGGDEETGWRDIKYFNSISSFPEYGFSPDGNFPVTYAEKGIYEVEFSLGKTKNFHSTNGGIALNAVCDYAYTFANDDKIDSKILAKYNLKLNGENKIEGFGKSAHGSAPQDGKNAIKPLLEYMNEMGENLKNAIDCLFNDIYGIFNIQNEQGGVTLSPNLIFEREEGLFITCDCRVPYPESEQSVRKILDKFNIPYSVKERHPPMCAKKDGWFVSALIKAYNSVTGESAKPEAMSGSTFARAFKYGCSFGPKLWDLTGNLHDANENMPKKQILTCYEIYKSAIFSLAKI